MAVITILRKAEEKMLAGCQAAQQHRATATPQEDEEELNPWIPLVAEQKPTEQAKEQAPEEQQAWTE
eukprot:11306799-Prorocentrum_lima.AAC.1